jgi:hypothetical protein
MSIVHSEQDVAALHSSHASKPSLSIAFRCKQISTRSKLLCRLALRLARQDAPANSCPLQPRCMTCGSR